MPKMLENKVALITGAGRGIGREIALMMAQRGARIVVNDPGVSLDGKNETNAPANEVVNDIVSAGGEAVADFGSVSESASARAMVQRAVDTFGRIDIVVNNAGILRDAFFHKMTDEDWDTVIKVHLYGSFYVSRAAAEHFRRQESGVFVNMTSTSGLVGNVGQANYSAAKLGIVGLSKSLALDMARFNVRSNCISPFAWSRMVGSIPNTPDQEERLKGLKMLTPDKIAPVAAFLASDAASEVTGQIFAVRGNEIFLMSQPRPSRSVHRSEGWTPETLRDHMLPALRPSFLPLEVSRDVFPWMPV
ncbi:SDR family oxidoreductase [Bosea sp. (in: a-proteobacteria)]|uniref:SDR family oxidoreductase n=1 Tax=Bosea sp. (in: a-proteobacteria) TaxID=1871050 RepID=UPI001AC4CB20|nr:SDR family oxidoreductase [Bosea sp. (in: a-proteobacteria)]MBN9440460.1 SDR family oxidoreductase [Bosea sp. (in: a-proteobacteria)]